MLTSNLDQIIGRVGRMPAAIEAGVVRGIAPAYWLARLGRLTERTLRAQWALETDVRRREVFERLTPWLVESITGELLAGPVTQFQMGKAEVRSQNAGTGGPDLAGAKDAYGSKLTTPAGQERKYAGAFVEEQRNLADVREGLLDWVRTEKRKETEPGGRDAGLSDEEIAERLEWILGLRGAPRDHTAAMQEAAEALRPHVQKFLDEHGEGGVQSPKSTVQGSTEETVRTWLAAVLAAWRAYLGAAVPDKVRYEIGRELGKLKGTMI